MLFSIHKAKLHSLFSSHPMDQQGSPCINTFLTVTTSYHNKAKAVLLYVFKIPFAASFFMPHLRPFLILIMMPLKRCVATEIDLKALFKKEA